MSTVTPEPRTNSLDEQIDYAEHLIAAGDLPGGASLLQDLRREALSERDRDAMQRIADIASASRYLSRRYQGRFDRLRFIAEGNVEVLANGSMPVPEPREAVGVGALLTAIALHLVIGGIGHYIALEWWGGPRGPVIWFLLWLGGLAIIVWRWSRFREDTGLLFQTSVVLAASAVLVLLPLLYFLLSEKGRRVIGLCRGPR